MNNVFKIKLSNKKSLVGTYCKLYFYFKKYCLLKKLAFN